MAKPKIVEDVLDEVEEEVVETKIEVLRPRDTFKYLVPETKEDHLALYQLMKDMGLENVGKLEVLISRL